MIPFLFFLCLFAGEASAAPQGSNLGELRFGPFDSRRDGDSVIYVVSDLRYRSGAVRVTGDYAVLWLDARQYDNFFGKKDSGGDKLHNGLLAPESRGRLNTSDISDSLLNMFDKKQKVSGESSSLPPELLRELYVEGSVYFSSSEKRKLEGSSLYIDFTTGRMLVADGTMQTSNAGFHDSSLPLSVRAKWFRREATDRFVADDAEYTTCTFHEPHQKMVSDQVWLKETPYGTSIDAYQSTFRYEGVPMFYLPHVRTDPETQDLIPFRGAQFGSKTNFGWFALTKWGQSFHSIGESFNDLILGEPKPFRGDWEVRIDHYNRRGEAIGPELEWNTPGYYRGKLRTYFLNDDASDLLFYPNKIDRETDQRRMFRFQNWINLSKEWTLDTEANYFSDPSLLPEFFRREYFTDKEPENYASLRWQKDNQAFEALGKTHWNDFDPIKSTGYLPPLTTSAEAPFVKESLPTVSHGLFAEPIGEMIPGLPVYYTEKTEAGYLRRRPSDVSFLPGTYTLTNTEVVESLRLDTLHELRAPIHAGPFILTPFIGERYTWYDDYHQEVARVAQEAGVRVATHAEAYVSDDLIHMIDPAITYENRFGVSKDPAFLKQFDDTDAVMKSNRVLLSLRNRLQDSPASIAKEKRKTGYEEWQPWADLRFVLPVYFEPNRDNNGKRFGNLETLFDFRTMLPFLPLRNLSGNIELLSNIDSDDRFEFHRVDFAQINLRSTPTENLITFASYARLRNFTGGEALQTPLGFGFSYKIGEKWYVEARDFYDLKSRQSLSHSLMFQRVGHDWVFEVQAGFNDTTGETVVAFNFQPRALFQRGRSSAFVSNFISSSLYGQTFYTSNGY